MRKQPPIGLMPKEIHDRKCNSERYNQVCVAITNYRDAGKKIPIEWIVEHNNLLDLLGFTTPPKQYDPKNLSDDAFIGYVLDKNEINYGVGDIVRNIRGNHYYRKLKVLSFDVVIVNGNRLDTCLLVNFEIMYANGSYFGSEITTYLERFKNSL